ncbi:cell division topological specificity factor homolog, chloroplastic-like isoform X1 [Papaver somniferum]|uniref:cell division topological specificity factor homolog, chloroplastic-like isoform X1 n=1 Tax=Papaver somniferum TaxID=3469 RepID=UPI000E6F9CA6|nr:cell division topological specificity factor homolog, chloroplastic-like isoform X1 [Papaver somniferum]
MATSGNFRGIVTSNQPNPLRSCHPTSKVGFNTSLTGKSGTLKIVSQPPQSFRITGENKVSPEPIIPQAENFLLRAINMSFSERLNLAWKVLFPPLQPARRKNSNAYIAKQRLKMVLFSDQCEVSDKAKEKIISKIICVLSDFVIIDSQDKVQLSVSTDPDLGTFYSVTVPVRRVKPEYQFKDEHGSITNIEYKDTVKKVLTFPGNCQHRSELGEAVTEAITNWDRMFIILG